MNQDVFVPTETKYREIIREEFRNLLEREMPKVVRRCNRKDFLTTSEFEELTGMSSRVQHYLRKEGKIPFSQEGRKIVYRTEDVEKFLEQRRVNENALQE